MNLPNTAHFVSHATSDGLLLQAASEGGEIIVGKTHLLLISRDMAEQIQKLDDPHALLSTASQFFSSGETASLRNDRDPRFSFGLLGAEPVDSSLYAKGTRGFFSFYEAAESATTPRVTFRLTRPAATRPAPKNGPPVSQRPAILLAPEAEDFAAAAQWTINVQADEHAVSVTDWLLRARYAGDVAHLEQKGRLVDDDFWNGLRWTIGLREVSVDLGTPLTLSNCHSLSKSIYKTLRNFLIRNRLMQSCRKSKLYRDTA